MLLYCHNQSLCSDRSLFQLPDTNYRTAPLRNYSDPYPQAIILTAIVIGFATQALLCAIALRLSRSTPLLRYKDLEK